MRVVVVPPGLSVAWMPTKIAPPQLVGMFLCKAAFPLSGGTAIVPGLPPSGDVAGEQGLVYASDFVPFKPRADVLVRASAHASAGEPVRYLQVSMRVGSLQKQLLIAGDRRWKRGLLGRSPGEPDLFTSMPIVWARALGGPKDRKNPIGRGRDGELLPNVEIVGRLVGSPGDSLPPAGFGPIAADWEPRSTMVGTYRGNYVKERWPWFPDDFDFGHFNAAPRDQQVDGYLSGDEELRFENLHRQQPTIETRLPGLRTRLFVTFDDGEFLEVAQRLDTLLCDLEDDRIVMVWRGHTPIRTPTMREIVHVLAVLEPLAEPKDAEHYRALLDAKPAVEVNPPPDAAAGAAAAGHAAESQAKEAAMEAELAKAEAQVAADEQAEQAALAERGIDPTLLSNSPPPQGIAAALAQAPLKAPPPPEILAMRPAAAEPDLSPEDVAEFEQMEAELEQEKLEVRSKLGWTRDRLLAALAAGVELAGEDLSGLDLSGCALAGARLERVMLTACNLGRADLKGASLRGSVLTGADLSGADLTDALLDRADFTGAVFTGARLGAASLAGAVLEQQDLTGMDLSGCRGEAAYFAGADLSGCKMVGADFSKSDLSGCKLVGADCKGAVLRHVRLHAADASKADFRHADLAGMRADDGALFVDADFRNAKLDGVVLEFANLHGSDLRYATMRRALLTGADLGQCDFSRADLERSSLADANLVGARLLQTNLRYASLERCDLKGADARQANLYGAGLWESKTELADLRDANLASTLLMLR